MQLYIFLSAISKISSIKLSASTASDSTSARLNQSQDTFWRFLNLSILLVFDPFEKVEEHLVILGFEMIIIALKVAFYDEKEYEEIDYWF